MVSAIIVSGSWSQSTPSVGPPKRFGLQELRQSCGRRDGEHVWNKLWNHGVNHFFPFPAFECKLVLSMQMANDPGSQEASSGAQGFQCTTCGVNQYISTIWKILKHKVNSLPTIKYLYRGTSLTSYSVFHSETTMKCINMQVSFACRWSALRPCFFFFFRSHIGFNSVPHCPNPQMMLGQQA